MRVREKKFVLSYVLENVPDMEEYQEYECNEEHFNIPWKMKFYLQDGYIVFFLYCLNKAKSDNLWSVQTEFEFKLKGNNDELNTKHKRCFGNSNENESLSYGWNQFIKWENLVKYSGEDGKVILEIHVKIEQIAGIDGGSLRKFDESIKEFSDVVVVVEGEKFYVSKVYLGLQSSYFNSLLRGSFEDSQKSEIVLHDINAEDFQSFLELLHGESSINDYSVDGILHLADMYDAPTAIRRCEEFLVEKSKKTLIDKLELSAQYNLSTLMNKFLAELHNTDDIQSVLPLDLNGLHPLVASAIIKELTSRQ